jgi:transposase
MLRSPTVHTIHDLASHGTPIAEIARTVHVARNTVKKYLRGAPAPAARPPRSTKLGPFHDQIRRWVEQDHLYNCVTMLERLHVQGYTGSLTQLKAFVHPFRPRSRAHRPVRRYETLPGEQMQFDWGEFHYERDGVDHKLFGFMAILSYSRMRFLVFTKRADAATLIRCLMEAFEYFGGTPKAVLTDRMKSVLLEMEDGHPRWHPLLADFVASLGIAPRVCKPYTPQTKGKVERSIGVIKSAFWPGVQFSGIEDLNQQAREWCDRLNRRVHATTHVAPVERWQEELLGILPTEWAWERFAAEERKVSWEGYFSYDGVLYGLPSDPPVAGSHVQVRERHGQLSVWQQGQHLLTVAKRTQSREVVPHPDQFRTVPPAASQHRLATPLGHWVAAPQVARRALEEYDHLCGVEVRG